MGRTIHKHCPHPPQLVKENRIFLVLRGLHQLDQIQIIIWGGLGNGKKTQPNNPAKNHRYNRTQRELPPGSCFSHAVLGWWPNTSCDIRGCGPQLGEENWGGTESSLLPSRSQNWGRFTNKTLRPFQNLLSTYFIIITPWNAPILHHCCKTSQALWFLCKTEHS